MTTHHVIVGGGPAGTDAIKTIREFDGGSSTITLICDEPAHSRMALPYWLSGQIPREQTHTADDALYQKLGVEARIGRRMTSLDPGANTLTLDDGGKLQFDDLLIATGASPVELPIPGADLPGVQTLWTLEQTQSLLDATAELEKPHVAMIGAGFIGFIMLNAMHKRGWQITVVEREPHVLPRMLDADAAGLVETWLAAKGVELYCGAAVSAIRQSSDGGKTVELSDGTKLDADVVIIAVGVRPNLDALKGSGIKIVDGILVNHRLQTNFPHIYAGGDVAQGPVLFSDKLEIHAIQPTAVDHGRIIGANMAGQAVDYPGSLSMNILDCCGLQCASFGDWSDASAEKTTICNASGHVFRRFLWQGERISGSIFMGRASDMGMLTDVGMVKGLMQTGTQLGPWKKFLKENPFDVRRPFVATNVAQKLAKTTLLGRPSVARAFRYGGAEPKTKLPPAHATYMETKEG